MFCPTSEVGQVGQQVVLGCIYCKAQMAGKIRRDKYITHR